MRSMRILALVAGIVVLCGRAGLAQTAAESFEKGQKQLAAGEFDAAVASFEAAAKADPANKDYEKRAMVAKRVADYRQKMAEEKDAAKWEAYARALRTFYLREKIGPAALDLAQQMNAKMNNTAGAIFLAETQLSLDKNAEGVATLKSIPADKVTPGSQALLALGLKEDGKADEGKAVAQSIKLPEKVKPGEAMMVARSLAAFGENDKAMAAMTASFENTMPGTLAAFKKSVEQYPEFASVKGTPEFAKAMATASKLKESECTGGSDCSSCPLSGKCPSGEKK